MDIKIKPSDTVATDSPQDFSSLPMFSFSLSNNLVDKSSGVEALAFRVIKTLFTARGSVPGSPAEGSILASVPGTVLTDMVEATALVEDAIATTTAVMLKQQAGLSRYKSVEKLKEINVISVSISSAGTLKVSLKVTNILGDSAVFNLGGGTANV